MNMLFQEIAVTIIGILVIGYVGWKIYRFLARPETSDPCAGCPGCALKDELKSKGNCPEKDITSSGSSAGKK